MTATLLERLNATLRDVPDFPTPGVLFKDITPVLADPALMREVVTAMLAPFAGAGMAGKNVENDGRAIDDAHIEGFFEVAGLARGKLFVKHDQIKLE